MENTLHTYISCLNGLPTSELTNISAAAQSVQAGTEFIVSKHIAQPNEPAEIDVGSLQYEDAVVNYSMLSNAVYDSIPKTEMMQLDKHEFAKASHAHPEYDWLKVWPDFGKNGKNRSAEVSAVLMTVHFSNDGVQNDVDICLPKIEFDNTGRRPKHLIGELMFVAAKSYEDVKKQVGNIEDVDSDNFSGWVYPNGQTIYTKRFEFMEAKQLFGMAPTAASFTVPDIAGYLKPTCIDDMQEGVLRKHDGKNGVPLHTHAGVVIPQSAQTSQQVFTKDISIANGRAKSCGSPLTVEERDRCEKEGRKGIVCTWPTTAEYQNALPAQHPAGYRYMTADDKEMFSVEYDDLYFEDMNSKHMVFSIQGSRVQTAGTEYDASNEKETMSWPESNFVPVLMYIGFPDNSKYKYWG